MTALDRSWKAAVWAVAACVVCTAGAGRADAQTAPQTARVRRSVGAHWTDHPPTLDGRLDEPEWGEAEPTDGFVQSDPLDGEPLTERTVVRVIYDHDNLYIGVFLYDRDPKRIVVSELLRDFDSKESDVFGMGIDPFHDRRNGYTFFVNAAGAKRDGQSLADGRYFNLQWDGVWSVGTSVHADGWAAEIALPFKTLGVGSADVKTMGINFMRRIRRRTEEGNWCHLPRRFSLSYMSFACDLTGLGQVATGGNLRVKPFATSDMRGGSGPGAADRLAAKVGIDSKYRVGKGLALDATVNTDFSQVEVDRQQVNLTRFSLFFPEKRDFFLENTGIFQLGDVPNERDADRRSEETQLFYSRRIGLSAEGQPLPLRAGVRLSGRTGPFGVGLLNVYQPTDGVAPSNNFTVARVRRDVFRNVDFGGILLYRRGGRTGDYDGAYGVDFNARLFQRWTINAYSAATERPGVTSGKWAHKVSSAWDDGFVNAFVLASVLGEHFEPQVGFVARPGTGVRNYQINFGLKPRPKRLRFAREINPHYTIRLYTDRQGRLLTREQHYSTAVSFEDGSRVEASLNPQTERLAVPFRIRTGVTIPVGTYAFDTFRLAYNSDKTQLLSGSMSVDRGAFYNGHRTTASLAATVLVKPHLSAAFTYDANRVDLPAGSFRADLYGARSLYSFTPAMFVDAYVQYNTDKRTTLTNVRFNVTYRPLSDFTVVYNENLAGAGGDTWRALVVKFTRLLQF